MHSYLQGHPSLIQAIRKLELLNPDQFEIYLENRSATKIDSKDQDVENLTRTQDMGLAIRLIKDRKLGFSFTTSLEDFAIDHAVDTAFQMASFMPEDPDVELYSFGSKIYPSVDNYDAKGLLVPLSEKINLAKRLEKYCRDSDPRITAVRQASISESCIETHLIDSHGEHLHHKSTGYSASITCKAEMNGDSQMGSDFVFSNDLDTLDIQAVGNESARNAIELLGSSSAPTLRCPAVFRNSVVADLVDFLSNSFSAEQIDKGRSLLSNKKDQIVFSELVTLINDGLLAGGLGTHPFDGEGVPSKKVILVDGGLTTNLLYDHYYARKMKTESTSSAVRGIKSPPSIGVSNFYMKKGNKSPESLIDGISKGILITDLMGLHTANPVTGHFSLGASGILIENSRLTRPVRGFAVAGNVIDIFRRITDVGNDLKFFGSVGAPSIRMSELSVSGV